jgi:hypothetical protein
MRTIVNVLFCPHGPGDPTAEVRLVDPAAIPSVGDVFQFDPEAEDDQGELCGRVTRRVFYQLPYHVEIDVFAEP